MKRLRVPIFLFAIALSSEAQTVRSLVGTVTSIEAQNGNLAIKPDNGEPLTAKISATTLVQGVAPGEKDLRKAQPIAIGQIAAGDRVLVSLEPGTNDARRIVVMAAVDIDKRNQADRQSWTDRGIAGVVTAKKGNEITLTAKQAAGERTVAVVVSDRTAFRRYAPDSVRFADAQPSRVEEIAIGDQLRARGEKSADGLRLSAEDVVFGTFLTKAGSVTSVDAAAREVRITELGTGKPLLVKLTADTQIKAMPELPAGGPAGGGAPFAGQPGARGGAAPEVAAGAPGGGTPFAGPPGARGGGGFRRPDPSEMIELMPRAGTDAIRQGQTILISSTKGAKPEELTAIIVVANAQMLIQMVSPRAGAGRGGQTNSGGDLSPGVMSSGMGIGGLDLSGMVP